MPVGSADTHSELLQRGLELVNSLILACSPPSEAAQAANLSEFWFNMDHVYQLAACLRDLRLGPWEVELLKEAQAAEMARAAAYDSSLRKGGEWEVRNHDYLMVDENAHRNLLRESLGRIKVKLEAIAGKVAPEVLARLDRKSDAAMTGFEAGSDHVIHRVSVATILALRERGRLDRPSAPTQHTLESGTGTAVAASRERGGRERPSQRKEATPEQVSEQSDALDDESLAILRALAAEPHRLLQYAQLGVATEGKSSDRTNKDRVPKLELRGLVHRPGGERKGITITASGVQFLADLDTPAGR
jgi:hypothetical protein